MREEYLADGPCAGQAVLVRLETIFPSGVVQPVAEVWVCRAVIDSGSGAAVVPGPWWQYVWNSERSCYQFGGNSRVGTR